MNLNKELARALRNHHYEPTDDGRVFMPRQALFLGGVFSSDVNGRDARVLPNLFVAESLVDVLKTYFNGFAQRTGFYLAPFSGDVEPTDALTAADFASTLTEFTDYTQSARVVWTPPANASVTTAEIGNTASPATFTVSASGADGTVWGVGLLTAQPKSSTSGILVAASKDATARDNLREGDDLNVKYTIVATDAG